MTICGRELRLRDVEPVARMLCFADHEDADELVEIVLCGRRYSARRWEMRVSDARAFIARQPFDERQDYIPGR